MSDILVVYYSLEGNTELAANDLHEITGADLEKLIPENEPDGKSFTKYLAGGFTALTHYKPRIKALKHRPDDYSTIVIAAPVWASPCPPAVETFLHKEPFSGKKVELVATSQSGKADAMISRISGLAGSDNTVELTCSLVSPLKDPDRTRQKLEEFCLAWA